MCKSGINRSCNPPKPCALYPPVWWHHCLRTRTSPPFPFGQGFSQAISINTLRPRQNGRHLPDDIFKSISFNENVWISIEISLKFVRKVSINNIPALVQIMAWRRPGDKPLSRPMMVRLPTHICVTRPQWVNSVYTNAAVSRLKSWNIISGDYHIYTIFYVNKPCIICLNLKRETFYNMVCSALFLQRALYTVHCSI